MAHTKRRGIWQAMIHLLEWRVRIDFLHTKLLRIPLKRGASTDSRVYCRCYDFPKTAGRPLKTCRNRPKHCYCCVFLRFCFPWWILPFQFMREEGCKVFVIGDGRLRTEGEGGDGMSPGGVTAEGGGVQVRHMPLSVA